MAHSETFAPGTEILLDTSHAGGKSSDALQHFQHAKRGDSHILLVPQPSLTDPNDPLRWSRFKKWLTLFNGLWYSFNGAVTGPIMAAGSSPSHKMSKINAQPSIQLKLSRHDPSYNPVQHQLAEDDIC